MARKSYQKSTKNTEQLTLNMNPVQRAPGVKPCMRVPTQAEVRADAKAAEQKRAQSNETLGYGPLEKFYKPEDTRIPDADTAEWLRVTKKTFGRPFGKYNPSTIKTEDIVKQMPNTDKSIRRITPVSVNF